MRLFDLKQDVAVVIGATGALGGAIAEGLAEAGARVAVLGRNAEKGEERVLRINQAGGNARFFSVDASKRSSLAIAHEQVIREFGSPTVLVNAAGGNDPRVTVTPERKFEEVGLEDWLIVVVSSAVFAALGLCGVASLAICSLLGQNVVSFIPNGPNRRLSMNDS